MGPGEDDKENTPPQEEEDATRQTPPRKATPPAENAENVAAVPKTPKRKATPLPEHPAADGVVPGEMAAAEELDQIRKIAPPGENFGQQMLLHSNCFVGLCFPTHSVPD